MTLIVFTFVLLLGNALREILPLLVSGQATVWLIAKAFALLIPFVLGFALPMAMLTAVLLTFGRFSADQELTAARASGVSLLSLISPIIILSLLLCGVSAWMNLEVAPRCRVAYNELRFSLKAAIATAKLPEGRFMNFPGKPSYIIYVGKNRKQKLEDVWLYELADGTNRNTTVHAPRGQISLDTTNKEIVLDLFDAAGTMFAGGQLGSASVMTVRLDLNASEKADRKPSISDMTFRQLQDELHTLNSRINPPLLEKNPDEATGKKKRTSRNPSDMTEPIRIQMHRQVAFSFACFGFTLVGIPLGIRVHRRETNVGVAIALALVFVYYTFLIIGQSMSSHPELAPHLWMWLPNFIFQAAGMVLLWRANRGV
ncbi:MAG: lipopolysaccharide export system permease protein [Verrucomicrobiota bacterium]